MKYRFVKNYRTDFRVSEMCRVLMVGSSGYYAWLERRKQGAGDRELSDAKLRPEIIRAFKTSKGRYGSPRMYHELKALGLVCGKRRVARLMRELKLVARRAPRRVRTTDSNHRFPVAMNVLDRRFSVEQIPGPDRYWCSDFTYVPTDQGWLYLAVVLDLFSRRVVGWSMSVSMAQDFVLDAFTMAVGQRAPQPGLLHHSDRGSQYAGYAHRDLLAGCQAEVSMSRKANCWDNAVIESFFSSIKTELINADQFSTREQARSAIFEYIEVFYNRERRHSTLDYISPDEYERRHRINMQPKPA
jgi:transposase InsO family protein